jgi:hypothetical protein
MKAVLALENGIWYEGEAAGAFGETGGEVVFNTSMTGYQEVLTDPSYAGQIVTMTAPEMGNYGEAPGDEESRGTQVAGFVIREESPIDSNWRSHGTLRDYLAQQHRRHLGHRYARARARAAVGGRDARDDRDRRCRSRRARGPRAKAPVDGGIRPRARRDVREAVRLDAGRPAR